MKYNIKTMRETRLQNAQNIIKLLWGTRKFRYGLTNTYLKDSIEHKKVRIKTNKSGEMLKMTSSAKVMKKKRRKCAFLLFHFRFALFYFIEIGFPRFFFRTFKNDEHLNVI